MKLTRIMEGSRPLEVVFEFDGNYCHAERFLPNTPAMDVAARLRALAARIEATERARATSQAGNLPNSSPAL